MPDDQYNGIEIEVNVYERAGQWTGEYILTKRLEAYTLNEVNSLTEAGETQKEARELALCEARRTIESICENDCRLMQRLARASRA
jgi:hypothetical protein